MAISDIPLTKIKNFGPKSTKWLADIGVKNLADLEDMGAVGAYQKMKEKGYPATLNMLWAIEAALRGMDWRDLPETDKADLKKKLGQV